MLDYIRSSIIVRIEMDHAPQLPDASQSPISNLLNPSFVVTREHLRHAISSGDIGSLRLLSQHHTAKPSEVLPDAIREGNDKATIALLESPHVEFLSENDPSFLACCSSDNVRAALLLLRDKRFSCGLYASRYTEEAIRCKSLDVINLLVKHEAFVPKQYQSGLLVQGCNTGDISVVNALVNGLLPKSVTDRVVVAAI